MPGADPANHEKARLIVGSGPRLDKRFIKPQRLRLDEINPVLGFIGQALRRIELVFHVATIG